MRWRCGVKRQILSLWSLACLVITLVACNETSTTDTEDASTTQVPEVSIPVTDTAAHPPDGSIDPGCKPNKTCADYPDNCGAALDDGCVGTIDCSNACSAELVCLAGQCVSPAECIPACEGKVCGDDGCGGSCGTCEEGISCANGACVADCVPSCDDKDCGDDGCGGSCGECVECGALDLCGDDGSCGCCPNCDGKGCGDDGCGGSCGECPADEACAVGSCVSDCDASCDGKTCGDDGCGGSCGTCDSGLKCEEGACVACSPDCTLKSCGADGCGGLCGACGAGESCKDFQCVSGCTAECDDKDCGDDGCGGNCGSCGGGTVCVSGLCDMCVPDCDGKSCGADGCKGSCGTCSGSEICVAFECVGASAKQLRINEVLADPATSDSSDTVGDANCDGTREASQDEFVELVNTGSGDLDLSGATLSDSKKVRHTFADETTLKPGEALLVFGGGSPSFDGSSTNTEAWCVTLPGSVSVVTASSGSLGLSNEGDSVIIALAGGDVLDQVDFGGASTFDGAQDQSLVRSPELTGSTFVLHSTVAGSIGAQSPGTRADGGALSP